MVDIKIFSGERVKYDASVSGSTSTSYSDRNASMKKILIGKNSQRKLLSAIVFTLELHVQKHDKHDKVVIEIGL